MRILIALVLAAAVLWSGYWVWGARSIDAGVEAAISGWDSDGVAIAADDIRVRGFPNRFDVIADAPAVTWREAGITWSAPILSLMMLSYQPNRAILALPEEQRLEGAFGTALIGTETARASMRFDRAGARLERLNAVVEGIDVTGDIDLSAAELLFATEALDETGLRHRVGLTVDDLVLPASAKLPEGLDVVDGATADAILTFAAPPMAGEAEIEAVEISALSVDWGEIGFTASGSVRADQDGRAEGSVDLALGDWRAALEAAAALGIVPGEIRGQAAQGLELLSALGGGGRLEVTVDFRDGRTFVGPLAIGPAPRVR